MNYIQLKQIALGRFPEADTCYDCGGVLHFFNDHSDIIGRSIAINKETGECMPFITAIGKGLVDDAYQVDFETGISLV